MEVKPGKIRKYLCGSFGPGSYCYIVSHPKQSVDASYATEKEAQDELDKLNSK